MLFTIVIGSYYSIKDNSNPYIQTITGLIDEKMYVGKLMKDFQYLPILRIHFKVNGALANITQFNQFLTVDFKVRKSSPLSIGTVQCGMLD